MLLAGVEGCANKILASMMLQQAGRVAIRSCGSAPTVLTLRVRDPGLPIQHFPRGREIICAVHSSIDAVMKMMTNCWTLFWFEETRHLETY